MRLSRRPEPFDSDQFIYELKIDGFRALAHLLNGHGALVSRNGNMFRGFSDLARGSVPITFSGGDMEASIPLSLVGNPKGPMNFKVISSTRGSQGGNCTSSPGVLDYMPNIGLPPGHTTAR
jgi:hypothetical protein